MNTLISMLILLALITKIQNYYNVDKRLLSFHYDNRNQQVTFFKKKIKKV